MTEIFLHIVNMSITATILAVVVLLLRLLLKKAPKWISVLLWGLVALRLICPFAVESPFSLMPKTDWVVQGPLTEEDLFLNSVPDSIPAFDASSFGSDVTVQYSYYPLENSDIEIHRGISGSFILSCVWAAGMAALLLHTIISTIRLHRSIGTAIRVRDNVWESSAVDSPFVLGIIRPRIYVPRGMSEEKLAYVIAHEEAHIRRKDHWWKPLGFLLLTIHWFNPVLWLAYILLCRDIEMACDERVIKDYDDTQRADYSEALLECSVRRSMIAACPLAFGEVGVKQRIRSILNYKKPAFWIVVVAVIACAVVAVCFLTNPLTVRNPWVKEYVVGAEGILGQVDKEKYESVSEDFAIGADKYGRAVFKDPFKAFDTMKELYSEGLTLIAKEQDLSPISQRNYNLYKKFGWQVTSGSEQAREQARFVSSFLDIYENCFDKEKPNTDLPAPTDEIIGKHKYVGYFLRTETNCFFIAESETETFYKNEPIKISPPTWDKETTVNFDSFKNGDKIEVEILQIGDTEPRDMPVYNVVLVEEGTMDNISNGVIEYLRQLGYKVIDSYEQEQPKQ